MKGEEVDRYVTALCRELASLDVREPLRTVFFGGGTPTLLSVRHCETILRFMDTLPRHPDAEWTFECNPATLSLDKARCLRQHGVNRVSLGIQSLDDSLLDRLGRVHSRRMVFDSYEILRQAGFDNVNIDLMFAIPGQTLDVWRSTLQEALALAPDHLSSYEVIYEEDTPLFAQLKAGAIDVDEELACAMYDTLCEQADHHGLIQYEVANFGRGATGDSQPWPQRACRHNVNYWRGGSFLGLGPSATSYIGGVRTKNWSNTRVYCDCVEAGHSPAESREQLSARARAGETAAFGLRMVCGWDFDEFRNITGISMPEEWGSEMEQLARLGYGQQRTNNFRLTPSGLRYADWAAELFLRPELTPASFSLAGVTPPPYPERTSHPRP